MKAIVNGQVITESGVQHNCAVVFDQKIKAVMPLSQLNLNNYEVIDAAGHYVSPGFVDIHKHGAYNVDTMDAKDDEMIMMLERLPETGVTSLYPTTMSMGFADVRAAIECVRRLMGRKIKGTQVMGAHMEGPFLSPDWGGAQPREYIVPADYKLVEGLEDVIKIVTVASEEKGNDEFIKKCVAAGIRVSLGHTLAHYEDALYAFSLGACSITHTFCAMHQLQHREPGVVAAASETPSVYCELIVDNLHIHPATQRALLKLKGIDRMILVSDSMRFAGMGYGESALAGQHVTINEKGAKLDNGFFAGSVILLNEAVQKYMVNNHLDMADALKPVTKNPAKMTGIYGRKGVIAAGADADFTIIDGDIDVKQTIVGGESVYIK